MNLFVSIFMNTRFTHKIDKIHNWNSNRQPSAKQYKTLPAELCARKYVKNYFLDINAWFWQLKRHMSK